jgi:titin
VTTFADTGASPLTQYYYRVTASNPIGSSAPSASVQAMTAPAAPVVSAVDVSVAGRVALTWGAVSGAVSYGVERSADGINWAGVGGGAGTTFQDTSVAAGTVYSYRVRAVGSSDHSDYGSVVTALTVAAAPGGLTAEPVSAGQVNLAWGSVTGAGTYRVERTANGVDWSVVGTTAGTTMSDSSVSGGVTYSYRVASVNASGTSAYSGLAIALTAPNQPTGLVAVSADTPVVTLSWAAVTGAVGYQVERSVAGSGDWTLVGTVATTGYVDGGLNYETSYAYRIRATNASGASAYSASASVTTPNVPIVLASPTALVVGDPTSAGATLTWQDNSDNELGFQIQRSGDGGQTWATVGLAAAGLTTYEDTTLSGGTSYQYRVRAFAGVYTSGLTEAVSVTTKPAAPIGVKVTTVSVSRLGVSWGASNGATSYEVERSADGETGWETVATVGGTSYEDPHLLGGTRQYYRVRAVSGVGASAPSAVATNVTIPAAPAFLVAVPTPDGPVGLAWAAVTGAGEYLIERSEDGVNWSQLVTTSEGIYMDTQVSAGTVYQYRARALGEAGASGTTTSDAVVTAPAAPVDPYALPLADGQINVSWVPVAGASAFVVERSGDGVSWEAVGTTEVNSYTDTGLPAKTRYFYRTRAINAAGTSDASAPIEAVTLQAAPDAPSALSLTPVSSDTVGLTWQDNSANESGFRVEYSRNNGKTWLLAGNVPANTSSVQVTGLETGDNYRFRVSAYNEMGLSRRSNAISGRALGGKPGTQPGSRVLDVQNVKQAMPGLTKKQLPDAATKVTARAYSTSAVQLTWKDNADNELGYRVEFSLDGRHWQIAGHTAADQTGCRVTNLQKGKTYHFRVRPYNLAGDASKVATVKSVVPTKSPVGAKGKPSFERDQDTTLNVLRVSNSVPGVTKALKVRMLRAA